MQASNATSQADYSFPAERLWSDAYVLAADTLRRIRSFRTWLLGITSSADRTGLEEYWADRGWKSGHHAVQLGRKFAERPSRTVGFMLAVNLPSDTTLRFAFPAELEDV